MYFISRKMTGQQDNGFCTTRSLEIVSLDSEIGVKILSSNFEINIKNILINVNFKINIIIWCNYT